MMNLLKREKENGKLFIRLADSGIDWRVRPEGVERDQPAAADPLLPTPR